MNVRKINVGNNVEELFEVKKIIERQLIEMGKINNKMQLDEFVDFLDFSKNIYIENIKTTIPFSIYKLEDEIIVFHCSDKEEDIDKVIEMLNNIEFDYTNLKELSYEEMMSLNLEKSKMFIINDKYFVIK